MAITIQDQPTITYVRPAFAPIEYLLDTDTNLTTAVGFKIICKIYVDPTGANTLISTQQLNIRPLATQAVFSIQDVVKSYVPVTYSIPEGDTVDLIQNPLSGFKVTFQEYYSGALQGSVVTANTFYAYYSSPKYIQFASDQWKDYQVDSLETDNNLLSGFDSYKPLMSGFSASDTFLKVKDTQKIQAQWIQRSNAANFQVWFKTLDSSFATISTSKLDLGTVDRDYYALDIGRQEVGSHTWDTSVVWTDAKYFAVGIYNELTTLMASNTYLYELDECTTNYTNYELHWLNRWGGFDSFVFDGKSKQETQIDKTYAKYATDRVSGTSLNYSTSAQRTRAFNTSTSESYELNSRLLHDYEVKGLEDLVSSPEVYYRSAEGFVSVNVNGSTYEHSRAENGQVFNLALTMTIDNSDERQW
tara:strand:- start:96 stop:1343 length:1248 start_codon:yes stop_codon:yes gene_type:complete